jgi:general secretion pathway protein J
VKNANIRGFTLIELLVAMSLLSVIMAGLVSALRGMAQSETKIDQRLQRLDDIRVARSFLQQTLGRVSGELQDAPGATGKRVVSFSATANSLIWVGILPARPNVGGRHFFRLSMEARDSGQELVLRFLPYSVDTLAPDWSLAEARVLVSGVTKVSVSAQGLSTELRDPSEPWPVGWQDGWPIASALPEKVRLSVLDHQGEWPPWIIGLQALPQTAGGFSKVTVGGAQ